MTGDHCPACGCDPDKPGYCEDGCPNWDCPCSDSEDGEG